MKRPFIVLTMILCGLLLAGTSSALAQKMMKKMMKQAMMMTPEDMKWEEMKGGPPGIMYCNCSGDVMKGAHATMIKLPANMKNPLHTHSADYKLVILSGSLVAGPEGGPEKSYGAGSFLMVPAGTKHTSGAGPDGCTMYQEGTGKFDMKPVAMPKAKM